jgi:hypothetical protein
MIQYVINYMYQCTVCNVAVSVLFSSAVDLGSSPLGSNQNHKISNYCFSLSTEHSTVRARNQNNVPEWGENGLYFDKMMMMAALF